VGEAPDLHWLITAFAERVPAVTHAAVVSADGLPLAYSRGFPRDDANQLAAIIAGLTSLAYGLARIFEGGQVVHTVVVMDRGLMVVRAISDGASLVALAPVDCDIGQVAYEMALLGEQTGHALSPAARGGTPARPPETGPA
jgi:predicted regulator of Ras-like GTPase activity (Roadblock/LC7/MglB family)